ncbi:hypothetical protein [Archangium minus]
MVPAAGRVWLFRWDHFTIPGAINIPGRTVTAETTASLSKDDVIVVEFLH